MDAATLAAWFSGGTLFAFVGAAVWVGTVKQQVKDHGLRLDKIEPMLFGTGGHGERSKALETHTHAPATCSLAQRVHDLEAARNTPMGGTMATRHGRMSEG